MVTVTPSGSFAGFGRNSRTRFSCVLFLLFAVTLYYWALVDIDSTIRLSIETTPEPAIIVELDNEELDGSRNYIRSVTNFHRALKFLHIPKNAGSAIEEVAGGTRPQLWGGCLFKHRPKVGRGMTSVHFILNYRTLTSTFSRSGSHVFTRKEGGGPNMWLGGIFLVSFSHLGMSILTKRPTFSGF